jgi:class 3 adenylate cyclase
MPDPQVRPSADLLVSYVPRIVARRLAQDPTPIAVPRRESAAGVCLLVDVAGFTTLTERLGRLGAVGAEEMAGLLADYFGPLVAECSAHGGEIIEFEGDSMLVVWWADDRGLVDAALRGIMCGLAMQRIVGQQAAMHDDQLTMRVVAAAGVLHVMHVGGVNGHKRCVVAGHPILELSEIAPHAAPGRLAITTRLAELVVGRYDGDPVPGGAVWVRAVRAPPDAQPLDPITVPPEAHAALREYVPTSLESRLDAGGERWLAEFRRATSVFVNILGLRYAGDDAADHLNRVTRAIQRVVYHYDGSIEKLIESDKGTVAFAAFGLPPRAHEDDPARGIRAALEIEEAVAGLDLRCAIGITTGKVFCGPIGGHERQDFAIVGDAVNLAARLMQAAADDILCDVATSLAFDSIEYDELTPISPKGKDETVRVFRPHGDLPKVIRRRSERVSLVGREAERRLTADALARLDGGHGGVVLVEGEAGIGKSRLVEDLIEQAEALGLRVLSGSGSAVEVLTPYFAWRPILWTALELGSVAENPGARRRHVLRWLRARGVPLEEASLLNSVLGIRLPDDPTVSDYTPEARAERTRTLLARVLAVAADADPLAFTIDDAQWLDSASAALVLQVRRDIPAALVVLAARPLGVEAVREWEGLADTVRVVLDKLPPDETLRLVCQSLGVDRLPDEVGRLILARAEGHPFFSEELAFSLRDSGTIIVEDGTSRLAAPDGGLGGLVVPDTVQGVILSRIDHLEPRQQLLLKVASIFGRSFQLDQVRDVFPAEGEHDRIGEDLRALAERGLLASPGASAFAFRHAMMRDVVYESMVYAQRRRLHRSAAIWLEGHPDDLDRGDAVLAHHWLQAAGRSQADAEALGKAEFYLARAGAAALRQGAFPEAEDFLSQALACQGRRPDGDRGRSDELEILKGLGTATFAVRGFGSPEARQIYERTYELARGWVTDRELFPILWGLWLTTHFSRAEHAVALGEQLMEIAEREDDAELRLQAHHALWTTLIQIPDYDRARRHLEAGAALYRPEWHERHCADFGGHDPGSCAKRATALTAWTTGRVDQAVVAGAEAIQLARDHGFSKLNAMLALAFVHRQRGDLDAVAEAVTAIVALAHDRGLLGYVEWANVLGAWVRAGRGDLRGGLSMMEAATQRLGMTDPGYMAMLAELYLRDGQARAGLGLVDELFAAAARKGERNYEPELHRLRGELLARDTRADGIDDHAVDACLRRARELADVQGALSFSLRACLSRARILGSTARSAESIALLRATYERFSEGFETQDLVDTREFLERHA